jgi:hypothetical protein
MSLCKNQKGSYILQDRLTQGKYSYSKREKYGDKKKYQTKTRLKSSRLDFHAKNIKK